MSRFKLLLLMLCCNKTFSQNSSNLDYARTFYNNENVISTTEDKFQLEFNLKRKLSVFSNFNNSQVILLNPLEAFNNENLKNLYSIDFGIKKEFHLTQNWTTAVQFNPQIRTNDFENLNKENFIFNTEIHFKRKIDNKLEVRFGIEYGTLFGKPSVYPTLEYNKIVNSKISYSIGFPKNIIKYNLNEKNNFQLISNYNSYYSSLNKSNSRVINQEALQYETIFLSKINTTVEYNFIFYDNSVVNIKLGKSFNNKLKIEESSNVSSSYNFNNDFIISMGFKYNLNFKQK